MMYRGGLDGGGGYPDFRMIPLDGKPHDPERALQYTFMGYTVGKLGRRHAGARFDRFHR